MSELLALYALHSDPVEKYEITVSGEMPEGARDPMEDTLREAARSFDERVRQIEAPHTWSRGYPRYGAAAQSLVDALQQMPRIQMVLDDPPYGDTDGDQPIVFEEEEAPEDVYARSFTSFSGADTIIYVGGELIGEVQSCEMTERMDDGTIEGWLELIRFDRESALYMIARTQDASTMRIQQANEYGQSTTRYVLGVRFQRRVIQLAIDNAVETERYYFTARNIVGIPEEN